jgi:hypothetical protein
MAQVYLSINRLYSFSIFHYQLELPRLPQDAVPEFQPGDEGVFDGLSSGFPFSSIVTA